MKTLETSKAYMTLYNIYCIFKERFSKKIGLYSSTTLNHKALQKTFNDLYTAEADAIFRFCLVRVSDREQALDLTQEVFTRFWQTLTQKSRHIEYPRAFLYTSARNAIIDWYRKKKSVSLDDMADEETEEPYEQLSDSAIEDSKFEGEGRFLVDSIRKLSDGHRDAVYLRFVEGLSPPEIAKILGISTNATSVRINRGIGELRKITGYDIENEV